MYFQNAIKVFLLITKREIFEAWTEDAVYAVRAGTCPAPPRCVYKKGEQMA